MGFLRSLLARFRGPSAETVEAPAPVRLVIGLGNPGERYAATRHNVGFRVVERLAARAGGAWRDDAQLEARVAHVVLAGHACLLIAPQTFMNASGRSVSAALERWPGLDPATDCLVIYDDMDLPVGRIRLRPKGGSGGHNGIGDIIDVLDSKAIPRLRFGVGHPGPGGEAVIDWVLSPFAPEEGEALEAAIERAADAVEAALGEGVTAAMGRFNGQS